MKIIAAIPALISREESQDILVTVIDNNDELVGWLLDNYEDLTAIVGRHNDLATKLDEALAEVIPVIKKMTADMGVDLGDEQIEKLKASFVDLFVGDRHRDQMIEAAKASAILAFGLKGITRQIESDLDEDEDAPEGCTGDPDNCPVCGEAPASIN